MQNARFTKRLSVVIPGYNTPAAWWRRAVASVLRAIGPDDEVLCVDDGSATRPACLAALAADDPRVRVICREANGGLSAARNTALDAALGRFVTFVDSDDEVTPDVYETTLKRMQETQSDVGLFGVKVVWTAECVQKLDVSDAALGRALTPDDVAGLSRRCLFNYAWNKVYDREGIAAKGGGWDLRFDPGGMPCEDVIFNLRVVQTGARWCAVPLAGYVYYRTDGTLLSRYKPTNGTGEAHAAAMWAKYAAGDARAAALFASRTVWGARQQAWSDWANIWRRGTPLSLAARGRWLRAHAAEMGVRRPLILFLRQLAFAFARRHFYFTWVRRRHIRRLYPNAVSITNPNG